MMLLIYQLFYGGSFIYTSKNFKILIMVHKMYLFTQHRGKLIIPTYLSHEKIPRYYFNVSRYMFKDNGVFAVTQVKKRKLSRPSCSAQWPSSPLP